MRYEPGHKAQTRKRLLDAAGRSFRLYGYDGIGIDGLASEAGITSGAFYSHFRNKQEAFQEAVLVGLTELREGIELFRAEHGEHWVEAFVTWYFSRERRQERACGCALPSLTPEVTRADEAVRTQYQKELAAVNEAIAAGLLTGTVQERSDRAWAILGLLSGGMILLRAVADADMADQIARATCQGVMHLAADSQRESAGSD